MLVLGPADVDHALRAVVTCDNSGVAGGGATPETSPATDPVAPSSLRVKSADATSAKTVNVGFNARIEAGSVTPDGSQFSFTGGLTATAASQLGKRVVAVTTTEQSAGTPYTVTVAGTLMDVYGDGVADAANTASFNGGSGCNALANAGPSVPATNVAGNPPVAIGGSISLGLYHLTQWQNFGFVPLGPTGDTRRRALLFSDASHYEVVTADNGVDDEHQSRTYSSAGTALISNQSCPTNDLILVDYSVLDSGNTLLFIAGSTVLTFTHS